MENGKAVAVDGWTSLSFGDVVARSGEIESLAVPFSSDPNDGAIRTLRRFKDDVREVREGNECGIALENYQDLRAGDVLEVYEVQEVQRAL